MTTKQLEVLKGIYRSSSSLSEIEIEALRSAIDLIEKLPVTMDGVIVKPGMRVYHPESRYPEDINFLTTRQHVAGECFSTRTAAFAAAKKEG